MDKENPIDPQELLSLYIVLNRKNPLKLIVSGNSLKFKKINVVKWTRISQILGIITKIYEKFALVKEKIDPE